ncbi:hypothetical protein [Streptomyces sp. NPDC087300]|uniref:hypothetical protein n=1 Tax=Streptomyces sp. NPDC087300 TaxID=3365780 RepID=UPI00380C6BEB
MSYIYVKLRQRCQAIVDGLSLPHPFTVESFCTRLAAQRQRSLHLHPLPRQAAKAGACGLWLATDVDDHIFFEQRTARLHQDHIILHEVGHMLFGHQSLELGDDLDDLGDAPQLFGDLSPQLIRRLLARTDYTTRREQEAEMLASLIRTRGEQPTGERRDERRPDGVPHYLGEALGVGATTRGG